MCGAFDRSLALALRGPESCGAEELQEDFPPGALICMSLRFFPSFWDSWPGNSPNPLPQAKQGKQ